MLIIFSGIRNLEIEPISGKKVVLPVFFAVTALMSHNNLLYLPLVRYIQGFQ